MDMTDIPVPSSPYTSKEEAREGLSRAARIVREAAAEVRLHDRRNTYSADPEVAGWKEEFHQETIAAASLAGFLARAISCMEEDRERFARCMGTVIHVASGYLMYSLLDEREQD